jgi:hypothetical protein
VDSRRGLYNGVVGGIVEGQKGICEWSSCVDNSLDIGHRIIQREDEGRVEAGLP